MISLEVRWAHNTNLQRSKPHSATTAPLLIPKADQSSYKYRSKIKQCSQDVCYLSVQSCLLSEYLNQITLVCHGHLVIVA